MAVSARQALREQQAAEAARERRRRLAFLVVMVLLVVLGLVGIFWGAGRAKRSKGAQQVPTGAALSQALQQVPTASLDAVGLGTANHAPEKIPGGTPHLVDGKPRILYVGGEFCPYCAMDRLSLVTALSRFGHFSGLEDTLSSPEEGDLSNIPTVTFRNATFTSDVISFTGVETADRMGQKLTDLSADDRATFLQYAPKGGIPFVFYGSAFSNSAPFDGAFLAGKEPQAVVDELKDPSSPTSKAVLGGANVITAQVCRETGGTPADVCTAPGVVAAAQALK